MATVILGLSGVETVALWAGLIVGVASVVLAIVAIYFSIEVDRRSARSATDTTRALQSIESAVEGQSRDTRDLIKVAWERLLKNVGSQPPADTTGEAEIQEIAAGLAAELRAALVPEDAERSSVEAPSEALPDAGDLIDELRETLASQLQVVRSRPGDEVQFWIDRITNLTEEAQVVLRLLLRSHLTASQFRALSRDSEGIGDELHELRKAGFLVPLEGYDREARRTLVYWLPPGKSRPIKAAMLMFPEPATELGDFVQAALADAGYPDRPS